MTPDAVALTVPDTARLLRATLTALRAESGAVPPAVLAWHPAAGEWCAKEVLGHLIEAERRGFAGRIRIILANDNPTFESWDQNEVSRARHDCERDWGALLTEFSALREESAVLVAGLAPPDLARGGQHPKVGYLRAGELLHEWVHHDRNHLRQMLANFQAYVWPHMGNTQRFSLP
jgi:hypothetical protein